MEYIKTTHSTTKSSRVMSERPRFQKTTVDELERSKGLLAHIYAQEWHICRYLWVFYLLSFIPLVIFEGFDFVLLSYEKNILNRISNPDSVDLAMLRIILVIFSSLVLTFLVRCLIMLLIGRIRIFKMSVLKYSLLEGMFFIIWGGILFYLGFVYRMFSNNDVLKMVLISQILGFFSVLCMVLYRERFHLLFDYRQENKSRLFLSIRFKFITISVIVCTVVGIVVGYISFKNMQWVLESMDIVTIDGDTLLAITPDTLWDNIQIMSQEVVLIIIISISWMAVAMYMYATNVKLILVLFNSTIYNVFQGDFNQLHIPALNDEFGVMGENINNIVKEIQEKESIKYAFGKLVSPTVADLLLKEGISRDKGGISKDIVVLSSDIRDFTHITHTTSPKVLVNNLNTYFTNMVEIIERYEGMVDKFIGDAIMSLFGYGDLEKGINNAVYAAISMQDYQYRQRGSINIGIGIGCGEAILGLIGGANRQDFTAIGNVVNAAFRLESCTKLLKVDILIQENVYKRLNSHLSSLPWKHFNIQVKGFSQPISSYGLRFSKDKYLYDQTNGHIVLKKL